MMYFIRLDGKDAGLEPREIIVEATTAQHIFDDYKEKIIKSVEYEYEIAWATDWVDNNQTNMTPEEVAEEFIVGEIATALEYRDESFEYAGVSFDFVSIDEMNEGGIGIPSHSLR